MAECNTTTYKKQKRRESRTYTRQATFVSDYIKSKYLHIYEEAAQEYNYLNQLYPCKPDLRRTVEYRSWKNNLARQQSLPPSKIPRQKYYKYSHAPHGNIPVSSEVDPTDSLIILPDAENQNPVPESPRPEPEKIMQLRIPLMTPSQTAPEPQQTHTESVEAPTEPVEIITEEVIQTPTESVEAPTEPVEIITEEVIQEVSDTLYPSLTDELAPEIVDNIIAELRGDPELKDIIVEMEQQLELEEVGLEIDIPDLPDPLEDELENLLW